ncbi:MAG: hypothetical protein JXL67_13780 [Calditrichaeota bacterium]|nr:hypothetical protein [Calditrichota bacterium]
MRDEILADRKEKFDQRRQWRKTVNRRLMNGPDKEHQLVAKTINQSDLCSVMNS